MGCGSNTENMLPTNIDSKQRIKVFNIHKDGRIPVLCFCIFAFFKQWHQFNIPRVFFVKLFDAVFQLDCTTCQWHRWSLLLIFSQFKAGVITPSRFRLTIPSLTEASSNYHVPPGSRSLYIDSRFALEAYGWTYFLVRGILVINRD